MESTDSAELLYNDSVAMPLINWDGDPYLVTTRYVDITTSNNIFRDSPKVTNSARNPGAIYVRILNADGAVISPVKYVAPGQIVTMDQILAFSGTYTVQAKAANVEGTYHIAVD